MPLSKYKHPDKYSIRFHQIIAKGRGVWWLGLDQATEQAATLEMRRFGYFKTALSKTPGHRFHAKLEGMMIRGQVMLNPAGYGYDVRITIKKACMPRTRLRSAVPSTNDGQICESLQNFLLKDS